MESIQNNVDSAFISLSQEMDTKVPTNARNVLKVVLLCIEDCFKSNHKSQIQAIGAHFIVRRSEKSL